MLRLGITGQADSFHARAICSVVNGMSRKPRSNGGVFDKMPELADIKINAIWDAYDDPSGAQDMAEAFDIPHVAKSADELAEMVDAVLILCGLYAADPKGGKDQIRIGITDHYKLASTFLKHKLPTYIDKPFAPTVEEARSVINVAQETGTPMLCASARRFSPSIASEKVILLEQIGQLRSAHVFGDWRYDKFAWYGQHAIDVLFSILGPDIVSVHEVGSERNRLTKLTYRNGLNVIVDLPYDVGIGTSVILFGKRKGESATGTLTMGRLPFFFTSMIQSIATMVDTGEPPYAYNEMLHVVRVLTAMEQSLVEKRAIDVDMNEG